MPTGVRLNLADSRRIADFLRRMTPGERDAVADEVLEKVARAAEERAKTVEIVRGRGNAPPLPDRLSWRTGHLTRSISTDSIPSARTWIVGSTVNYAPVHELGLRVGSANYPVRAFLTPAAEWAIAERAEGFFLTALDRARGGAG
jgi:hypothetical protein